jgi:hypothetical protein
LLQGDNNEFGIKRIGSGEFDQHVEIRSIPNSL